MILNTSQQLRFMIFRNPLDTTFPRLLTFVRGILIIMSYNSLYIVFIVCGLFNMAEGGLDVSRTLHAKPNEAPDPVRFLKSPDLVNSG